MTNGLVKVTNNHYTIERKEIEVGASKCLSRGLLKLWNHF
jgi:hypothetical protein